MKTFSRVNVNAVQTCLFMGSTIMIIPFIFNHGCVYTPD